MTMRSARRRRHCQFLSDPFLQIRGIQIVVERCRCAYDGLRALKQILDDRGKSMRVKNMEAERPARRQLCEQFHSWRERSQVRDARLRRRMSAHEYNPQRLHHGKQLSRELS